MTLTLFMALLENEPEDLGSGSQINGINGIDC